MYNLILTYKYTHNVNIINIICQLVDERHYYNDEIKLNYINSII